ncbi:MAG: hypothetical protein ACYC37_03430 [Desulfobacteria bacterium]
MGTATIAKRIDAQVYPVIEEYRRKSTKDLKRTLELCDRAIELGVLEPSYFAERGMIAFVLAERKAA